MKKKNILLAGFTMLEIMIAVTIIAIIVSIVVQSIGTSVKKTSSTSAQANSTLLNQAVQRMIMDSTGDIKSMRAWTNSIYANDTTNAVAYLYNLGYLSGGSHQ